MYDKLGSTKVGRQRGVGEYYDMMQCALLVENLPTELMGAA